MHVPGGIDGRGCTLIFEKLPNSDAPLLLSAQQLEDLGAEIYTAQKKVIFRRLSDQPVQIETSAKGHLMVDITKFPRRRQTAPIFRAKEVDVWMAEGCSDDRGHGILHKKVRKMYEAMLSEMQNKQHAIWKLLRAYRSPHQGAMLKELYLGEAVLSVQARLAGHEVGAQKDLR